MVNPVMSMQVDQQIIFDDVTHNDGNHYNPTTGIFTVPIRGVYAFFLICTRPATSGAHYEIAINHNDVKTTMCMPGSHSGVPTTSVATSVINCEAGDRVHLTVANVENGEKELLAGPHTTFCGSLVHSG